jgi:hypothetical protein
LTACDIKLVNGYSSGHQWDILELTIRPKSLKCIETL